MLLIYGNEELWSSFPQEEFHKVIARNQRAAQELRETGEYVGAFGVAIRSGQDRAPRRRHAGRDRRPLPRGQGVPRQLRHHRLRTRARALEIAARVPFARIGQVEVRPLMHEGGSDDVSGTPARSRICCGRGAAGARRARAPVRQFDACEDAVQEALLAAARSGRREGVPDNPRAG